MSNSYSLSMFQFRINYNTFPSTKFSLWISHMVILQPTMISVLNFLELHRIKLWQWRFCSGSANISTLFQPLANPPSCITALYAKDPTSIPARCPLQIRKISDVSMPSQLTPNIWIITTVQSAVTNKITLICPGQTT